MATSDLILVVRLEDVLAVTLRTFPVIVLVAVSPPLARFNVMLPSFVAICAPSIIRLLASFTISELPADVRLAVTTAIAVVTVTSF